MDRLTGLHDRPSGDIRAAALSESRRLPRVLYLTDLNPSGKFGSLEEQIFVLTRAFRDQNGFMLPVFGAPIGDVVTTQYRTLGFEPDWLNLHRFTFANLRRLLRLIRRHRIELVHWHFYGPFNPYVVLLSALHPRLVHYFTDHNSRIPPFAAVAPWPKAWVKRLLYGRYRKVLCVSQFVLQSIRPHAPTSHLQRCVHFINTDRFRPDAQARALLRQSLDMDGRFVAVFVGTLIRWKGADVAIRALAELPESVVLWIVGTGPEADRFRALCRDLGVQERVRFFGVQRYVEPFLQAADCLVCPSRWAEAAGLAILEASACELPVLASATGGIPEFVTDGETGFLSPPGDHHLLAEQIRVILKDPQLRRALGEAGRKIALDQHSIERRLPEYVELYRDARVR